MINIIVDKKENKLEIEGHESIPFLAQDLANITDAITKILNKAYYSGEVICVEIRDTEGNYTSVDRWYPR